jgi:hypothetical protein
MKDANNTAGEIMTQEIYVVFRDIAYEGSDAVRAFESEASAAAFCNKCNTHEQAAPHPPAVIEDTPENDAEFDLFNAAYDAWREDHPARGFAGLGGFSVRSLTLERS